MPPPHVWHRFRVSSSKFRVQDLTADHFEVAVKLLLKHFTADEPPCKHIEVHKHPGALAELENLWRSTLKENLSLICVEDTDDEEPRVVGLNVLTLVRKTDKDEPFHSDDPVWSALFGAVEHVARSVDIFSRYNVEQYLSAYGLVVAPEYRGMKIGAEILKARVPLCRSLHIPVTATVFTAGASQHAAERAGFETLSATSYQELARIGFVFPGIETSTHSSKLMALVVEQESCDKE